MIDLRADERVLETERLRLEPLLPQHATQLFPVLSDLRIYTYIPEDPLSDQDALRQRYQRLAIRHSPEGDELWLNWALQRKQEHDYIGVLQATVSADQHATIAYMLHSAFWGYGYAQEACRCLLTALFDAYDLHHVDAEVDTRNQASWRLLERLGFRRVAFRQAADHFKGANSDEYTYELTSQDWQSGGRGGIAT
ncbi:MAG: GNAT family protein [Chloroflexi bacterium]|nr:GNAT family protein [Chloroflexota bacterium]